MAHPGGRTASVVPDRPLFTTASAVRSRVTVVDTAEHFPRLGSLVARVHAAGGMGCHATTMLSSARQAAVSALEMLGMLTVRLQGTDRGLEGSHRASQILARDRAHRCRVLYCLVAPFPVGAEWHALFQSISASATPASEHPGDRAVQVHSSRCSQSRSSRARRLGYDVRELLPVWRAAGHTRRRNIRFKAPAGLEHTYAVGVTSRR